MIRILTAKAGMASVAHKPMEKKSRKSTYTCDCVKEGSLQSQVNRRAPRNENRNHFIDFFRSSAAFKSSTMAAKIWVLKRTKKQQANLVLHKKTI